jgi:hypothetical protein
LAQKNPRHPRKTPSPIHFLPWAQSTTQGSRIIPVSFYPHRNPTAALKRPAASVPAASGHYRVEVHEAVAAGGKEHLRGRQYHITAPHRRSTSPLPPFLGPDRRRHLLDFGILSGNLPVLSPSLFLSAGRGSGRYVVVAPCLELVLGVSGGGPCPCGARMTATSAPLPCFKVPGRVGLGRFYRKKTWCLPDLGVTSDLGRSTVLGNWGWIAMLSLQAQVELELC